MPTGKYQAGQVGGVTVLCAEDTERQHKEAERI